MYSDSRTKDKRLRAIEPVKIFPFTKKVDKSTYYWGPKKRKEVKSCTIMHGAGNQNEEDVIEKFNSDFGGI